MATKDTAPRPAWLTRPLGIMGRFDPMRPDMQDALKTWRDQPYMLGVRMTFRCSPSPLLEDDTLNRLLDRL